jgi:hypothetical protein
LLNSPQHQRSRAGPTAPPHQSACPSRHWGRAGRMVECHPALTGMAAIMAHPS